MLNSSPLNVEQSTWLKKAALHLCFLLFPISRFPILLRRLKEQGRGNKITFISCNLSAVLELRSSLMKPKPQSFFFIFTFILVLSTSFFFLFGIELFLQSSMKKEKQSLNFTISSMTKANLYITCGSIDQKRSSHLWICVCHFCGNSFCFYSTNSY